MMSRAQIFMRTPLRSSSLPLFSSTTDLYLFVGWISHLLLSHASFSHTCYSDSTKVTTASLNHNKIMLNIKVHIFYAHMAFGTADKVQGRCQRGKIFFICLPPQKGKEIQKKARFMSYVLVHLYNPLCAVEEACS